MDESRRSSFDTDGPSFGIALAAVLVGGLISGFFESLLFGVAPLLTHTGWTMVTSPRRRRRALRVQDVRLRDRLARSGLRFGRR